MAGGAKIVLKMNVGTVIQGMRVRSARMYELMNEATTGEIGQTLQDELLPRYFPGKIAESLVVDTSAARLGGRLAAVRVRATNSLWKWYVFGTALHTITPINALALSFWWEKMGYQAAFASVEVSAKAHMDAQTSARNELRMLCWAAWSQAMHAAWAGA